MNKLYRLLDITSIPVCIMFIFICTLYGFFCVTAFAHLYYVQTHLPQMIIFTFGMSLGISLIVCLAGVIISIETIIKEDKNAKS